MTQTLPSVCPLDCPDTCSLTVTVQDEQIVKVRGSQVNPLTRGAICGKVSHYPEWVHGPDRLQTPLLRTGPKGEGQFTRLTWDLAVWYRDASPAVICPGTGLERNQNGGSGVRAMCALPALAGKFGVPGGGILLGASAAFPKPWRAYRARSLCPQAHGR